LASFDPEFLAGAYKRACKQHLPVSSTPDCEKEYVPSMKISSELFAAFLKCPTKCWLRAAGEQGSGNPYAEWVKSQIGHTDRQAC